MNDLFDNSRFMDTLNAMELLKDLFFSEMPMFRLSKQNHSAGYFSMYYSYEQMEIMFGSGRGYIEYEVKVDNAVQSLLEFEPLLEHVKVASEKNFLFVLYAIKRFFETNLLFQNNLERQQ